MCHVTRPHADRFAKTNMTSISLFVRGVLSLSCVSLGQFKRNLIVDFEWKGSCSVSLYLVFTCEMNLRMSVCWTVFHFFLFQFKKILFLFLVKNGNKLYKIGLNGKCLYLDLCICFFLPPPLKKKRKMGDKFFCQHCYKYAI